VGRSHRGQRRPWEADGVKGSSGRHRRQVGATGGKWELCEPGGSHRKLEKAVAIRQESQEDVRTGLVAVRRRSPLGLSLCQQLVKWVQGKRPRCIVRGEGETGQFCVGKP
jgi:hypothetical protein